MKLSITITTKNRKGDLLKCIESIRKSDFEDYELIIVDDNSSDGTELLEERDFDIEGLKIIHSKEDLMMVGARNLGAKSARGKYSLFIDDDNVVDKEMITQLVKCADKYGKYGIIGPSIYYLNPPKVYFNYQKINLYVGRTISFIAESKKEIIDSDGIPNVFLIKREVFDKCGYFDPELIQTFTEPDFAFRVRRYGFKCGVCQKAKTFHKVGRKDTLSPRILSNWPQKAYCLIRNRTVLVKRYGNFLQKVIYLLFFSWLWPLVYSISTLSSKRYDLIKLYWYGFWDGVVYFSTGRLVNSLPSILDSNRG